MVERLVALEGGLDGDIEVGLEGVLSDVVPEPAGAQAGVEVLIVFLDGSRYYALGLGHVCAFHEDAAVK